MTFLYCRVEELLTRLCLFVCCYFLRLYRMTVFTTRSKETPEAKKVLDSAVCIEPSKYRRDETDAFARLRRHRAFTSCCLLLLILWLLIASFLAGIFFYRQFYKRPTFYGWCGTNFVQRGRTERLEQSLEISPDEVVISVASAFF